ncbi:hypothetical protein Rleg9DRAFT_4888 [Rhizobium leguminosarum bv. trifolii WSM597]|uniref:Uncharacterized protein n=1 Tax=Rhizobium leguminosarum bv. trifolii WSM597 TaxID=754764 RepID=I9XAJ3_RHILT|nr:hypothetical protein [Rhizobium leguminosarum]EJB05996.1 hypothetical protein Rleg9DRAFT_4888 [Rhizobium leguminosarum bv. trifolii WSM597]
MGTISILKSARLMDVVDESVLDRMKNPLENNQSRLRIDIEDGSVGYLTWRARCTDTLGNE